jgi:hypothetical protein
LLDKINTIISLNKWPPFKNKPLKCKNNFGPKLQDNKVDYSKDTKTKRKNKKNNTKNIRKTNQFPKKRYKHLKYKIPLLNKKNPIKNKIYNNTNM